MKKELLLSLGNVYVETNFLGLETGESDNLLVGKEYSAPDYEIRLGGSAVNFATQVRKMGLSVGLIGKTGKDKMASELISLLKEADIDTDFLKQSDDVKTNIDTGMIFARNAQNIQIVAGSANQSLSLEDLNLESDLFNKVQAVYFGGAFKQKLLWPKYHQIFETLHKKDVKLFLDHGRIPVEAESNLIENLKTVLSYTDIYFPNESEILGVTGETDIDRAIDLVNTWGPKIIVVKRGSNGAVVFSDGEKYEVSGYKIEPISTVGAGDSFNAGFIFKYLSHESLENCLKYANATAAIRVSKNYQPEKEQVEEFIFKH